jgi:hypothetical protein
MGAAEQVEADHAVALGVRCERCGPSVYYVGRVGQFTVRLTLIPGNIELLLCASDERDFPTLLGLGETLEDAERHLERTLHARAERLAEASQANEEPLSADDAARLRIEAEECEQQERDREERAYCEHLRGCQRRIA